MQYFSNNSLTGLLNNKISSNLSEDLTTSISNSPLYGSVASITGTIDAGLDAFGIRQLVKHKCVVCGKYFEYLPFDGFCSFNCFSKWALKNILGSYDSTDSFITQIFNMVRSISQLISGILNLIASLPTLIHQVDTLPSIYQDYLKQKISWLFTYVDIEIDKLMIKKNEFIIKHILDPIIQDNKIIKQVADKIEWIQSAVSIVQQMQMQLGAAYKAAKSAILSNVSFLMPPESFGFYKTSRTMAKKPLLNIFNIPTDLNVVRSVISDKNIQSISKFLSISFPPITEAEYLLDENLFSARLLASSLNAKNISENIKKLNLVLKFGAQYLPPYEELSLANPNYDVAMYFGWAPTAAFCFGCPIMPYALY